ncbi:hypothetical protein RN04_01910 [Arthrobacter sp. W1]|nr:hypothetical protein RN04_01910 [Arthrobacter sp. W1]
MTTEVFSITADRPEQETLPLFALARESDVKNVGMGEQNLLSLSYGKIVRKDINSADGLLPASFETYQIVEPGMTILRFTDLQNDQRSLRSGLVTERGIITSTYVAVDPFAMAPRFFAYMMRAYDTNKVFYGMGGGVRQGLNFDSIRRLPVPNLPFDEQRAIADYLDQETAQIDALVAKQEEFIELLRERRSAAIESAVVGVKLYGSRLKHLIRSLRQGWSPQCYSWPTDGVECWAVLKTGAVNGGVFRAKENKELPSTEIPRPEIVVRAGDLVVSRTNTRELVGSAAVVDRDYPKLMLSDKLMQLTWIGVRLCLATSRRYLAVEGGEISSRSRRQERVPRCLTSVRTTLLICRWDCPPFKSNSLS